MSEPVSIMVAGRATVDLIMEIDQFSVRAEKFKASNSLFVVGGPGANASISIAKGYKFRHVRIREHYHSVAMRV